MKRIRKFLGKLKRTVLFRLEQKKDPFVTITFSGNGADGIVTDHLTEGLTQKTKKAGALKFCVTMKLSGKQQIQAYDLFYRNGAEFCGYYIRKKTLDGWVWLDEELQWSLTTQLVEQNRSKYLVRPDSTYQPKTKMTESLVFEAQWKSKADGREMTPGYEIFSHPLMAHAMGKVGAQKYSNTKEAFLQSYQAGYRYFEVDIAVTHDDVLVISHGWDEKACKITGMKYDPAFENMTEELFLTQNIHGMQVMNISQLVSLMKQYEDTYFAIDLHRTDVTKKISLLVKAFEEDESLLNRLLIQGENRKILKAEMKAYKFKHFQLILGPSWLEHLEEGIDFVLSHGVETIAMRQAALDEKSVKIMKMAGINVMAYTIDKDVSRVKQLLGFGVNTICTDSVTPKDIEKGE